MHRLLVLLSVLSASLALNAKRQGAPQCPSLACGTQGGTCNSYDECQPCGDAFSQCRSMATNDTEFCDCHIQRTRCYNAIGISCGSLANRDRDQCLGDFASKPGVCSCGPVSPFQPVEYFCPFPATNCVRNRCVTRKTSGPCTTSEECGDPNPSGNFLDNVYSCQNISGTFQCAREPLDGAATDFCSSPADCADNNPCVNGRCQGKAAGVPCDSYKSCAVGLYCSYEVYPFVCSPYAQLGGNCTARRCSPETTCANGVCVLRNSVPIGGACTFQDECVYGSLCNNTCKALPPRTTCSTHLDCNGGLGSCSCGSDGYKYCDYGTVPANCDAADQAYLDCVTRNGCSIESTGAGSCVARFCSRELLCYYSCYFGSYGSQLLSCVGYPSNCTANPTSPFNSATSPANTNTSPIRTSVLATSNLQTGTESSSAVAIAVGVLTFVALAL